MVYINTNNNDNKSILSESINSVILFYSPVKKTRKPVINLQEWVEYMISCDDTF